jgi:hypothetical protein
VSPISPLSPAGELAWDERILKQLLFQDGSVPSHLLDACTDLPAQPSCPARAPELEPIEYMRLLALSRSVPLPAHFGSVPGTAHFGLAEMATADEASLRLLRRVVLGAEAGPLSLDCAVRQGGDRTVGDILQLSSIALPAE